MKKLFFALAACAVIVSCKKIQAGGNQGVLKLEEGTERYDDHEVRAAQSEEMLAPADSLAPVEATVESVPVDTVAAPAPAAH